MEDMKFKDAMSRLDAIVSALNNNELELEQAMELFEEGLKLTKYCDKQLKQFETKMDQLMEVKETNDASES